MAGPETRSLRTLGMFQVPTVAPVPTLDTRTPYGPALPPPPAPLAFLAPWLEGAVDLVRGGLWGSEGAADTMGAKAGELMSAALPLASLKGLGFFSRVDKALDLIPAKGAHPNKVASLLKSNASAEELAYRNVPEFLAGKGNATVTRAELAAHLAAHPAPVPVVKTRTAQPPELLTARQAAGDRASAARRVAFDDPKDWIGVVQIDRSNAPWWAMDAAKGDARALRKLQEIPVDDDHLARLLDYGRARNEAVALERQLEQVPAPKYHQYTVPGGENYRETLLTLPKQQQESYSSFMDKMVDKYGEGFATESMTPVEQSMSQTLWRDAQEYGHTGGRPDDTAFRSGHFEEPNILVHTRANERTLPTGERGRFVEEVQSDWHQKGKKEGYAAPPEEVAAMKARLDEIYAEKATLAGQRDPRTKVMLDEPRWHALSREQDALTDRYNRVVHDAVPDAPFKETWPDLGLKQQVLETAADPNAEWIGFTGGATQAARYDLSKQIGRVDFEPASRGDYSMGALSAYDHEGKQVIREGGLEPSQLDEYIGKDAADNLRREIANREWDYSQWTVAQDAETGKWHGVDPNGEVIEGTRGFATEQGAQNDLESYLDNMRDNDANATISGLDLQVGGEGMRHFYDSVLPKRLEKIVKPFGGTVERGALTPNRMTKTGTGELVDDPTMAWFARLTPEMKARILKEGLPLMSLLPLGVLGNYGQQPAQEPTR